MLMVGGEGGNGVAIINISVDLAVLVTWITSL